MFPHTVLDLDFVHCLSSVRVRGKCNCCVSCGAGVYCIIPFRTHSTRLSDMQR